MARQYFANEGFDGSTSQAYLSVMNDNAAHTSTIVERRRIEAPATDVWALVADYGHDPSWRAGVATMAPSPPGLARVGTTTCEDLRFAGRRYRNEGRVLEVDAGRAFRWETTSGARADGARRVTPLDHGSCEVVLELHVQPTGVERLFAPALRRLLARALSQDADRLVALAEARVVAGVSGR
jgi:uncharacterized protein YndB with AHSA1/START domain